jgi:hypothetical protein
MMWLVGVNVLAERIPHIPDVVFTQPKAGDAPRAGYPIRGSCQTDDVSTSNW